MTCDDAFDALTDMTRAGDADLGRHLSHCPRCRQMREVLQPALALFAPADAESAGDAVAHRPLLTPDVLADADRAADALRRPSLPARSPRPQPSFWLGTAVAAVLFFALAGFGVATLATNASRSKANAAVACLWQKRGTPLTSPSGRTVTSRQVVLSCVACHSDAAL